MTRLFDQNSNIFVSLPYPSYYTHSILLKLGDTKP